MTESKSKEYLALILATYAVVLIVVIIKGNTPSDANEFFELIGAGIGVDITTINYAISRQHCGLDCYGNMCSWLFGRSTSLGQLKS